jgi:anionic cell wall polymer biosynthesis LytR-Cps2A-Psr (LCP) family protein
MDGVTAGLYARSRHGRSDWNRARRQQAILFAMKRQLLSVDGLFRMSEVMATLETYVDSKMSRAEILALGTQAARLSSKDIHGLVLGYRQTIPTHLPDGKQVLVPRPEEIESALGSLFSAPAPGAQPEHASCFDKDAALSGR